MNRHLVRLVASVTAVSVLSLGGAYMATASASDEPVSAEVSNSTNVAQLKALRERISAAKQAEDAPAVLDSVDKLRPLLADIRDVARTSKTLDLVEETDDTAAQIQRDLPGLAGLPNPLQLVTGLLTSLLSLITTLLSSLLGGLPVPDLPVDLPVPLPLPRP